MAELEKAYFINLTSSGSKVYVLFNPADIAVKKTIPWNADKAAGKDSPKQQFTSGQARMLSIKKLEFDTTGMTLDDSAEPDDVRSYIYPLFELTKIVQDSSPKYPPIVQFGWGSGMKFNGVIKSMNVNYTKFSPSGIPVRANMKIDLIEVDLTDPAYSGVSADEEDAVEIKTAAEKTTIHTLAGTTAEEQENWRDVADRNPSAMEDGNPRSVPPGADVAC